MENIVFERDYEEEHRKARERHSLEADVFEASKRTGFWKAYGEMMDAIPKVIVPADKAAYEDLLPRLDDLARRLGGKIHGEISYEKWESHIKVVLPFLEFGDEEGYDLFKDLASKTHLVTITSTEDRQVCLDVMINYFAEIEDPSKRVDEIIANNKELMDALEKVSERNERRIEMLASALNPVLDYAEEQTGKDRADVFSEMLEFLSPYADQLDVGLQKYIEAIGEPRKPED